MSDRFLNEAETGQPAYVLVVEQIRKSKIRPGNPLPSEAELRARLGIGRPQLREALAALEIMGAVESRRGARRTWRGFNPEIQLKNSIVLIDNPERVVGELLEVRHTLETSLLPTVVSLLTQSDFVFLRSLADDMNNLASQGKTFFEEDEKFHRTLLKPAKNHVLDGILATFWGLFESLLDSDDDAVEDPSIASMHGQILDALEIGDTRLAVHHLDTHFYGVRNRYPNVRLGTSKNMFVS